MRVGRHYSPALSSAGVGVGLLGVGRVQTESVFVEAKVTAKDDCG